jgi:hypothetical protein
VNSTEAQPEGHQESRDVVVTVTGCVKEDARTVFDALRSAFLSDRPQSDAPRDAAPPRPTVWVATVDVSELKAVTEPAPLSAPVTIDVQGGYWAVDRFRRHLTDAFSVRVVGTAAGDQEEETRLRLENR